MQKVVQIVVNNHNDEDTHPFHLHGHTFLVLGKGANDMGDYNSSKDELVLSGVRRDTQTMARKSWLVIRIITNNPGIYNMTSLQIQATHFRHLGLRQLVMDSLIAENGSCTVLALLHFVVDCFPNLNSLEVTDEIGWAWPIIRLGPLQLMNRGIPGPGSNQNQYNAIWTSGAT